MQCFFDTSYCALIRWILWQAKTTLFVGQHLKPKTTLILGRMEYYIQTYGPSSTKSNKEAQNTKESLSLSACGPPPSPWLHVRPNAPPTLGSRPLALRLSPDRRPAVRLPPPDLPISATATPPVADRSRLAALVPTPQHQHEGGRHWLLLWICYGRYNLIVHYIVY